MFLLFTRQTSISFKLFETNTLKSYLFATHSLYQKLSKISMKIENCVNGKDLDFFHSISPLPLNMVPSFNLYEKYRLFILFVQ